MEAGQLIAVTEGDKVEVQTKLGWQVNTWAVGDLVKEMAAVTGAEIDALMETYKASYEIATYNLVPGAEYSLGAHMLEVCPCCAAQRPRIETHHLGIGMNEKDPARLVFEGKEGDAIVVSLIDMGGRCAPHGAVLRRGRGDDAGLGADDGH